MLTKYFELEKERSYFSLAAIILFYVITFLFTNEYARDLGVAYEFEDAVLEFLNGNINGVATTMGAAISIFFLIRCSKLEMPHNNMYIFFHLYRVVSIVVKWSGAWFISFLDGLIYYAYYRDMCLDLNCESKLPKWILGIEIVYGILWWCFLMVFLAEDEEFVFAATSLCTAWLGILLRFLYIGLWNKLIDKYDEKFTLENTTEDIRS